jgi:hypothetical protein
MTPSALMTPHPETPSSKSVFGENYATDFECIFAPHGGRHFGMCFFNAVIEKHRNGGEIVFKTIF